MSASDLAIMARLGALPAWLERFDVTAPVIFAAAGLVLAHGPPTVLGVAGEGVIMDPLIDPGEYAALAYCTYLNQASLGLIPRTSLEASVRFLADVAQHGNLRLSDLAEARVLDGLRRAGLYGPRCLMRGLIRRAGLGSVRLVRRPACCPG